MFKFDLRNGTPVVFDNDEILAFAPPRILDAEGQIYSGTWNRKAKNELVCDLEIGDILIRMQTEQDFLRIKIELLFKVAKNLSTVEIPLFFRGRRLRFMQRNFSWQKAVAGYVVDALTPACFFGDFDSGPIALIFEKHGAVVLEEPDGRLLLLMEDRRLHPRVYYHKGHLVNRGEAEISPAAPLKCEILIYRCPHNIQEFPFPVVWRYPEARLSSLVITDHADWDSAAPLHAVYFGKGGLEEAKVKTTKSVFFRTKDYEHPEKKFNPEGLDHPDFLTVMDQVHSRGHEICPHSVVPTVLRDAVPQELLIEAVGFFSRRYQSGTWIDHGTSGQLFNYSRYGWKEEEWGLCGVLAEYGFKTIWSSVDTSRYPARNLNQLSDKDGLLDYLLAALKMVVFGRMAEALVYLRHMACAGISDDLNWELAKLQVVVKNILMPMYSLKAKKELLRSLPARIAQMVSFVRSSKGESKKAKNLYPVLFWEKGRTINQSDQGGLTLFNSQLVNNWDVAYSNLKRLVDERGVHIAHTYLANTLPHTSNAVKKHGGQWEVTKPFQKAIASIGIEVSGGAVWNPTMREFAQWFSVLHQLRLEFTAFTEAVLENPTPFSLKDFCMMAPSSIKEMSVEGVWLKPARREPCLFRFDLPAFSKQRLKWKNFLDQRC